MQKLTDVITKTQVETKSANRCPSKSFNHMSTSGLVNLAVFVIQFHLPARLELA